MPSPYTNTRDILVINYNQDVTSRQKYKLKKLSEENDIIGGIFDFLLFVE